VTVPFALKLCSALVPLSLLCLTSFPALAQSAPPVDSVGAHKTVEDDTEKLPAYHHSIISWEHSVTAQTLGVGETPQSSNPTYTMGFVARLRYYLVDDTPKGEHFSLRLDGGLYREFTNSDVTTRRGEWLFSDTDIAGVYARRIHGRADTDGTLLELRPLQLSLPTSKISIDSGRYFAAGVLAGIGHSTPILRGKVEPELAASVRLAVGYQRWFARATVPTNGSLERVRLTPDGRTQAGDELAGSSLVRDQLSLGARLRFEIGKDVLWTTDAALAPAWKYDLQSDVCVKVATGCADVQVSSNDSRYVLLTAFSTEVSVRIARAFSLDFGYSNAANQLGRDGRRRSFFYSPDSTFYASVSFFPHELATPSKQLANSQSVSPNL
jgi:hypothetical protein